MLFVPGVFLYGRVDHVGRVHISKNMSKISRMNYNRIQDTLDIAYSQENLFASQQTSQFPHIHSQGITRHPNRAVSLT